MGAPQSRTRMSKRRVNIRRPVRNAFPRVVTGISSERSSPGSASTTWETAFTTRMAVASMAPAPLPICRDAGLRRVVEGSRDPDVEVRLALQLDVVGEVSFTPMGQSVPTCRASRVMWSITIASRPSTMPIAWKRIALHVPGWTVPKAVDIGCSVSMRLVVGLPNLVDLVTPRPSAMWWTSPSNSLAMAPGSMIHGSKSSG